MHPLELDINAGDMRVGEQDRIGEDMKIIEQKYGITRDGKDFHLYTIKNSRLCAKVTDLGAVLVELYTPDRDGNTADIVLGFEDPQEYLVNGPSFGATVGPNANRIAGASFVIDGNECKLPANEGENNLHSDGMFCKRLFEAEILGEDSIKFTITLPDQDAGFPGNRTFHVTYTLTETDLRIDYLAVSDKKTLFNLTNHSYFNLAGEGKGDVLNHILKVYADDFTPLRLGSIPTGEIRSVHGTPLDFTSPKEIGRDIDAADEQLQIGKGYDHNYVIDGYDRENPVLRRAAELEERSTGRKMEVLTTSPGVQVYTSNTTHVAGGKKGKVYGNHCGVALETQFYPDSVHHENFPSPIYDAGVEFRETTIYRFPCIDVPNYKQCRNEDKCLKR